MIQQRLISDPIDLKPIEELFQSVPASNTSDLRHTQNVLNLPTEYHDTQVFVEVLVDLEGGGLAIGDLIGFNLRNTTRPSGPMDFSPNEPVVFLTAAQLNAALLAGRPAFARIALQGTDGIRFTNDTGETLSSLRFTFKIVPAASTTLIPAPLPNGWTRGI